MSEVSEKRRRKGEVAEQPSDSKSERHREKKGSKHAEVEDKNGVEAPKKSKKSKKEVQEEPEVKEDVEIDLGDAAKPPRSKKKKRKAEVEEEVVESSLSSSTSEEIPKKPKKAGGLAVSRKWDQEDLEVIVPDEEVSDEGGVVDSSEEGGKRVNGRGGAPGGEGMLSMDEIAEMDDEEKQRLDWLTRAMPDEVLRNVYSFLDPLTVDGSALVCHRTNDLVQRRDIWAEYRPEWKYVRDERFKQCRKRSDFAACYNHEMKERRKAKERQEESEWRAYLEWGSEWAKGFMTLLMFNRSIDYLTVFMFMLGAAFSAARSQEAILWNWRIVLIPFYVILAQLWFIPMTYDLCRIYFTSSNVDDVTDSLTVWHIISTKFRSVRPILYAFNFCSLVFFILLMIKLNNEFRLIPAGVVIIPLLVFLVIALEELTVGFMIGESWGDSSYSYDRCFLFGTSFFLIPFLIMIVLKLDNVVTANWVVVLVPFYILCAWFLLYPLACLILITCSYSNRDHTRLDSGLGFFVWLMVNCMGTVPIFVFVLLTALNLDGFAHRSWPVVFSPLFVGQCLLLGGCFFFDFVVMLD